MIENESQQGGLGVAEPALDDHDATAKTAQESEHNTPHTEDDGLSTANVIDTLKELGPLVSTVTLCSLILPGLLGTTLLFGSLLGMEAMTEWITGLGPAAPFIAAILMAVATGSCILPTYALSFVAGVLFGFTDGGLVAMVGVTGGSLIGYFWGSLLARGRVMEVIERHERASVVRRAIVDRSLLQEGSMVALIRIPPNSPFALTNLLLSATSVRLLPYTLGSMLGIAPRTLFAVWIGAEVQDLTQAQSAGGTMRVVIGIAIGIAIFVLVYKILSGWAREALAEQVDEHAPAR